jgi:RNA polymerase sigma factor (sigma-70 family)
MTAGFSSVQANTQVETVLLNGVIEMATISRSLVNPGIDRRRVSEEDRRALVRAFRKWCGDPDIAEDLTQETLLEAWRSTTQPEAAEPFLPWLFGIARNILLRWRRTFARHRSHILPAPESDAQLMLAASSWNLEEVLEGSDLADLAGLLDGVLARIPSASREALVLKYIDGFSQKEIAARLGIHEKALEGKLHRGKSAIQRYLTTDGAAVIDGLDLLPERGRRGRWIATRLWCPNCGRRKLEGRWGEDGPLWLDCPSCEASPVNGWRSEVFRSYAFGVAGSKLISNYKVKSFSAARKSLTGSTFQFARDGIFTSGRCVACAGETRAFRFEVPYSPAPEVGIRCIACGELNGYCWIPSATSSHPLASEWMIRHPRHRLLPPREVERNGRQTLVFVWESLTSSQEVAIFRDSETLEFRNEL